MHHRRALTWLCVLFFKEVVSKEESVILKVTFQMGAGTGQGQGVECPMSLMPAGQRLAGGGTGGSEHHSPWGVSGPGPSQLRACVQRPLQAWVVPQGSRGHTNSQLHNTGVQSCTWSCSFTWAALGMSHTAAATRPGGAAPASQRSGKTQQAQEIHWLLQAGKGVQLSRESQKESGEQKTYPFQPSACRAQPT